MNRENLAKQIRQYLLPVLLFGPISEIDTIVVMPNLFSASFSYCFRNGTSSARTREADSR